MSSESLHENAETLGAQVVDTHRAIVSLMEELEAVDWYNQRAKATADPTLRAILEHNRDEEKEHAAMALEWLRRNDSKFAEHLKTFLFSDGPITGIEAEAIHGEGGGGGDEGGASTDGSLGIGSLRGTGVPKGTICSVRKRRSRRPAGRRSRRRRDAPCARCWQPAASSTSRVRSAGARPTSSSAGPTRSPGLPAPAR